MLYLGAFGCPMPLGGDLAFQPEVQRVLFLLKSKPIWHFILNVKLYHIDFLK